MTGDVLAGRYADALLDLTLEEKIHEQVRAELETFTTLFEERDLNRALVNPSLSLEDKLALLDEFGGKLKLNKLLNNFLKLLVERKRIGALKSINEAFQQKFDDKVGRIRAEITLPKEASKAEVEEIQKGLEKSTGKDIVMDVKVDPSLIGGVVARVGSVIYDGSLRTQIGNIKKNIMRG